MSTAAGLQSAVKDPDRTLIVLEPGVYSFDETHAQNASALWIDRPPSSKTLVIKALDPGTAILDGQRCMAHMHLDAWTALPT